jgi:hypothetical protein
MNLDDENSVVVKTFMSEFEAEIAKGMLEEEGIECYVSSDDTGGMRPHLQLTLGVRLIVMEKDLQRTLEILDAYNDYTPEADEE